GEYAPAFLAALDWALEMKVENRPQEARILRQALGVVGTTNEAFATPHSSRDAPAADAESGATFTPDPALLAEAKNELARHLGPIANVVVKQALASAVDWRGFCAEVAVQIGDNASRQFFLEAYSGRDRIDVPAGQHRSPVPERISAMTFDASVLAGLEAELASYLGAIARVVVKRCASQAKSKGDLYERIGAEFEDPVRARKYIAWAESKYGRR
ncbi:MAG: hypothetical protein ABI831_24550, partial [Betaproteobacteria bacterium]